VQPDTDNDAGNAKDVLAGASRALKALRLMEAPKEEMTG
jgi:hypothetical protein